MREEKAPTDEEFRRVLNGLIGFLIIGMILATIIVFLAKGSDHFFNNNSNTEINQTEIITEAKCKCNTK